MKSCSIKVFSSLAGIMTFSLCGMNSSTPPNYIPVQNGVFENVEIKGFNVLFSLVNHQDSIGVRYPTCIDASIKFNPSTLLLKSKNSNSSLLEKIEIKTTPLSNLVVENSVITFSDEAQKFFKSDDICTIRFINSTLNSSLPNIKNLNLYVGNKSKINCPTLGVSTLNLKVSDNSHVVIDTIISRRECMIKNSNSSTVKINNIYWKKIISDHRKSKMLAIFANQNDSESILFILPKELAFYIVGFLRPNAINWEEKKEKIDTEMQVGIRQLQNSNTAIQNVLFPLFSSKCDASSCIHAGSIDTDSCITEGNIQAHGFTNNLTIIGDTKLPSTLQLQINNSPKFFKNEDEYLATQED